ncbi:hypothetical protein [Streptomyces sp. NPDC085529]|uniref:hypothetical protein n=1 Tax=Streptomyces sp. NPDC085529 TaxID=3365729 RepID=UPI0037CF8C75
MTATTTVIADASVRKGPAAFTDHSVPLIDLPLTLQAAEPDHVPVAPAVDPRTIRIPEDSVAGVVDPAYPRVGDETQPHPDEWSASITAGRPEERDAGEAIRDRMPSRPAAQSRDFMKPSRSTSGHRP